MTSQAQPLTAPGAVRIGISGHFSVPARNVARNAERGEEADWAGIWWPDAQIGYHPAAPGRMEHPHEVYDWAPMVGAAAMATSRVPLGVSVTDPFRRHPAMLAQTAQTLQDLSEGRFILGLGLGGIENLAPFGIDGSSRVADLEDAIDILQLLWSTTEPVSFEGRRWRLDRAVLDLDSTTYGAPPIWLGGTGPRTLDLTGRKADGWVPVMPSIDNYELGLAAVHEAAVGRGRQTSAVVASGLFPTIAGTDLAEVERMLDTPWVRGIALSQPSSQFERLGITHPLGAGASGMRDFVPTHASLETYLDLVMQIPLSAVKELVLWGDADQLAKRLGEYREVGLQHAVVWNLTGLGEATPEQTKASFTAIAAAAETLR